MSKIGFFFLNFTLKQILNERNVQLFNYYNRSLKKIRLLEQEF